MPFTEMVLYARPRIPSNLKAVSFSALTRNQETYDLLAKGKGKSGLLRGLCEILVLDDEVTNGQGILRDEALHGSTTILNGELGAI